MQVYDASVSENFFALLRVPSPSPGVASGPGSHAATLTECLPWIPTGPTARISKGRLIWRVVAAFPGASSRGAERTLEQ
jgi:hypothetical protein